MQYSYSMDLHRSFDNPVTFNEQSRTFTFHQDNNIDLTDNVNGENTLPIEVTISTGGSLSETQ